MTTIVNPSDCNGKYIDEYVVKTGALPSGAKPQWEGAYGSLHISGNIIYGFGLEDNACGSSPYLIGVDAQTMSIKFAKKIDFAPYLDPYGRDEAPCDVTVRPGGDFPMAGNGAIVLNYQAYAGSSGEYDRYVMFIPDEQEGLKVGVDVRVWYDPSKNISDGYDVNRMIYTVNKHIILGLDVNNGQWNTEILDYTSGQRIGAFPISFNLYNQNQYLVGIDYDDFFFYDGQNIIARRGYLDYGFDEDAGYDISFRLSSPFAIVYPYVYGVIKDNQNYAIGRYNIETGNFKVWRLTKFYDNTIQRVKFGYDFPFMSGKFMVQDNKVYFIGGANLEVVDSDGNTSYPNVEVYFLHNLDTDEVIINGTNFNTLPVCTYLNLQSRKFNLFQLYTTDTDEGNDRPDYLTYFLDRYVGDFDLCYCSAPIDFTTEEYQMPINEVQDSGASANLVEVNAGKTITDIDYSFTPQYNFTWCGQHPTFIPFTRQFQRIRKSGVVRYG